jgi:hypothetical protein
MEGVKAFPSLYFFSTNDDTTVQKHSIRPTGSNSSVFRKSTTPPISAAIDRVNNDEDNMDTTSCPTSIPKDSSSCEITQFSHNNSESECRYNYVAINDESDEDEELVPSISCTCSTDGLWACGIHPEYMLVITSVPMI